ncbi:sugar transferase [Hyphomicrobium sp. D-2]|uniref:sugar transferase n=1 Tax=Hyphomicrobium sp. D-2 TaxID=3041621 RepID=UPI0024550854|nr:sugar transferase [Hyphomicrobium sp. D-2]MDH4981077.1 sugar transferase [Hyphomicrobium sp. D-2]
MSGLISQGLLYRPLILFIDLLAVAISTVMAFLVCSNMDFSIYATATIASYLAVSLAVSLPIFMVIGSYRYIWRFSALGDYLRIVGMTFIVVMLSAGITLWMQLWDGVPQSLPIIQFLLMTAVLVGLRVMRRLHHVRRRSAIEASTVRRLDQASDLLVGTGPLTDLYLRALVQMSNRRDDVVGILGYGLRQEGRQIHSLPVLGRPEDVTEVVKDLGIQGIAVKRIIVLMRLEELSDLARKALGAVADESNVRVEFIAEKLGFTEFEGPGGEKSSSASTQGTTNNSIRAVEGFNRRPYFVVKRLFDVMGALALSVVALPLALIIALSVALDVGLPVLFWQRRPGKNGRPFWLCKFRTMGRAYDPSGRKLGDEERVSFIGHFLRRTRLDEIPQLYNILIGDMSFVGPRPLLPIDQSPGYEARLLVRPGLTGLAQVAGGREISALDKAALDICYIRNASFTTDLKVVTRTVPLVLFGDRTNQEAISDAWRDIGPLSDCGSQPKP